MARFFWILVAMSFLPSLAQANDGVSEMDAGGLVFTQNRNVALLSEDLRISPQLITVRYIFRNQGSETEKVLVSFPLPDIDAQGVFPGRALPRSDKNFVSFTVKVDGAQVSPALEEKALLNGADVTASLKDRLPLDPLLPSRADRSKTEAEERAGKLPPGVRQELVKAGLIDEETNWPNWIYSAKFYWQQDFPPNQDVVVEHSYVPVTGEGLQSRESMESADYQRRFCIDPATSKAIGRLFTAKPEGAFVHETIVPYILTTANTWAGPIGTFTLTVDKGKPDAILSLCRDGIRKTGPTTFQWSADHYTPSDDLRVLIVSRYRMQPP